MKHANQYLQQQYQPITTRGLPTRHISKTAGLSTTQAAVEAGNWSRCFVWRPSAAFLMTGWCATTIATSSWSGPAILSATAGQGDGLRVGRGTDRDSLPGKCTASFCEIAPPEPPMVTLGVTKPPKASRWKPPADHPWKAASMLRATTSAPP